MVGIISNNAALFAQVNLERASTQSELSIARLSSGNKIIRASDDVAGLAIGTVLGTTVATLRTILTNTNQATSLLGIADGGAKSIGDILQRQKALAVSATAGTLSDTERAFLNEEFQALATQINQTTENTKFNAVTLLDGSIFDKTDVTTNTSTTGTAASGTITTDTTAAGDYITINGVRIDFTAAGGGGSVQTGTGDTTRTRLLAFLNASTDPRLSEATYAAGSTATSITVTNKATGTIGNSFALVETVAAGSFAVSGAVLAGGVNGDIFGNATITASSVKAGSSDAVGDSILTALTTSTAPARATGVITIGTLTATDVFTLNGVAFTAGTDFTIGGSATASALNLAAAINASANVDLARVNATHSGAVLTVTYEHFGTAGNAVTMAETGDNITAGGVTLGVGSGTAGAGTGIYVNQIANNADFVGTIKGFKATYVSTNSVNVEIKVGSQTYTATIDDTTPTSGEEGNEVIRFYTVKNGVDGGGFFDIELAAGQGSAVTDQTEADAYAARLDAAFSTITFYQDRDVNAASFVAAGDIYTGTTRTGTLSGASVNFQLGDFGDAQVSDITVAAPGTGATDAKITIKLANGEILETGSGLTNDITDAAIITLTSTTNPNHQVEITFGSLGLTGSDSGDGADSVVLIESTSQAASFESALKEAFGLGVGGGGLLFQVGTEATATIKVAIDSVKTSNLYKNSSGVALTLDIGTTAGANTASATLDLAINKLTNVRATIGALQSRFEFASASLTTSVQNTEAARAGFLDVDIASESTAFATSQVRLQASISVLAQANQLPQNLLKLIG